MQEPTDAWVNELLELYDGEDKVTERQIRILQAAVEIFSEKGYASTSTSQIAQKAGVAEGTIFRYFKTKNELLLAIVTPMISKILAPLVLKDLFTVLHAEHVEPADLVRGILRNRLEFARRNMPILKVFLQEIPFQPELREKMKKEVGSRVVGRALEVIRHYQQKGQIVPLPSEHIVRVVVSAMFGYVIARFLIVPELEWDDDRDIEIMVDLIMNGLTPR